MEAHEIALIVIAVVMPTASIWATFALHRSRTRQAETKDGANLDKAVAVLRNDHDGLSEKVDGIQVKVDKINDGVIEMRTILNERLPPRRTESVIPPTDDG